MGCPCRHHLKKSAPLPVKRSTEPEPVAEEKAEEVKVVRGRLVKVEREAAK